MPRTSTIERHPNRREIERALANGEPERTIATRFDIDRSAVRRHKEKIAGKLDKLTEKRNILDGEYIRDELQTIRDNLTKLVTEAFADSKPHTAIAAIDKQLKLIQTLAVLNRESREDRNSLVAQDITLHPEYQALESALLNALRRHPKALAEVKRVFSTTAA